MSTEAKNLWASFLDAVRPPPVAPIWEWAEETLRFTAAQSRQYSGRPWAIKNAPHTRIVFDFLRDPQARELHIMKSSAAAFSTAILVGICWHVRFRPCRVLYCLNNATEMRKVSKAILQPFLRQVFGDVVIDDKKQAALFIQLPRGAVIEMGSPTEGFFANKQASIIVMDEYDIWPDQLEGGVTDPLSAARGRFKGSESFAKLFTLTAPQRRYSPGRKEVNQPGTKQHRAFLSGDQREFRITCPGCQKPYTPGRPTLYFDDLRQTGPVQLESELLGAAGGDEMDERPFDMARVRVESRLRCPSCSWEVHEGNGPRDKVSLVRAGSWVATAPDNGPKIWSATYNDTCALIGDSALGTLAAELITSQARSRHEFIQVCRARFAEPESDEDIIDLSLEHARRHCGTYKRGTCPVEPFFIALIVDCQKGPSEHQPLLFKWLQIAFQRDGTSHVIDYGSTASQTQLRHLYESPIPYGGPPLAGPDATPVKFYCGRAVIDSGYRAGADLDMEESYEHHVYPLCVAWGTRADGQWQNTIEGPRFSGSWHLVPMKGRSREQMVGDALDTTYAQAAHPVFGQIRIPLHFFNDPWFKSELYHNILAADPRNPRDERLKRFPRLYLPESRDDLDEQFLAEITSERLMDFVRKIRGKTRVERVWRVPSKAKNDWGDTLKMSRVLWALINRASMQEPAPVPAL